MLQVANTITVMQELTPTEGTVDFCFRLTPYIHTFCLSANSDIFSPLSTSEFSLIKYMQGAPSQC